jgi:hypothetical protein
VDTESADKDGLLITLKLAHKMSAEFTKFVVAKRNWFVRRGGCSTIDFYNSSYERISSLYSGVHHNINLTSTFLH